LISPIRHRAPNKKIFYPGPLETVTPVSYKLIAFNARFIHSCLALFYVRAALDENLPGCHPEIQQYTINDPYYKTLRRIGSGEPAAFFFSVYIWNSIYIQRLVRDLVKLHPARPIILGGPQAGALAQDLPPGVFRNCTVVPGEIEGIEKTFYLDLTENRLKRQYNCTKVARFTSPYSADDFGASLKNRHIYYESSRGCPFGCTYCLSASEKGVRRLPTSQVQEEINDILRFEPKVIRFVDRTFNDIPARALDIWKFLIEKPGATLFHFEMAPDRFTEEMFQFLEHIEPSRFQFELGIQSTNSQTLEAINRKCDLTTFAPNIQKLVSLDSIHIHLDLILGLPYENRESFIRSFKDVYTLAPHYIQMGLLKVLPDTPISKAIEEYGLAVCDDPPYEILATRWLDAGELESLFWFGECVEAFFNNRFFRSFWEYLRKTNEDMFTFFEALLILCRAKSFFDLAATQELMSSLLLELTRERPDRVLLRELLIFDWLRCGHHFLPSHLEQEPISRNKKKLWKQMPLNWEGVYDYKNRDEFFKQGVFIRFTGELLREIGLCYNGRTAYVCFQANRENTVFKLNCFKLIPESILGP
jgi:radical SAM superfamily enzyme YgiQ (UPF0313 family)